MKQLLLVSMVLLSSPTWAECQREDIEFYLSKGFSPDQITQLCMPKTAVAPAETVTAPAPAPITEPQVEMVATPTVVPPANNAVVVPTANQQKLLQSLSESLRVKDLRIEDGKLAFRHQFRAKYGEEDVFGNLQEVKPWMAVKVDLNTMRLIKAANRIPVLRTGYILLSGDIDAAVVDRETYKPKQLAGIAEFLAEEVGQNTVKIKVNSDHEASRAGADIQELGLMYRQ